MPVIGYDCNGKPLHPGDRCVLLKTDAKFTARTGLKAGSLVGVVKKGTFAGVDTIIVEAIDKPVTGYELHTWGDELRKIPKDQHRSADRSFEDLMRGIKTLMPETNHL